MIDRETYVALALNCSHVSQYFDVLVACPVCVDAVLAQRDAEWRATSKSDDPLVAPCPRCGVPSILSAVDDGPCLSCLAAEPTRAPSVGLDCAKVWPESHYCGRTSGHLGLCECKWCLEPGQGVTPAPSVPSQPPEQQDAAPSPAHKLAVSHPPAASDSATTAAPKAS